MSQWVGQERMTIDDVVRRLTAAKERTRMGRTVWDRTTVWDILKNPAVHGDGRVRQNSRWTAGTPSQSSTGEATAAAPGKKLS